MYDLIIIGGGPAGYLAAERLAGSRKRVLLVEERHLGGTCLNVGCIPTKTLLGSAKLFVQARESESFGIKTEKVSFDWGVMQSRKAEVIGRLRGGIEGQMKRLGVETINARGALTKPPSGAKPAIVKTLSPDGTTKEHEARAVLVSTGSQPFMPPIPGAKGNPLVLDSTGLLDIKEVPRRLVVIGGGVIGVEFAGLFSALGSEVTVIEILDEIVPFMDREQSALLRRAMTGISFVLGSKVEKIDGPRVHYSGKTGEAFVVEGGAILMAVGRRPLVDSWGAESAGVDAPNGGVVVDDRMRTNIPGIWAAGDVTGRILLAHAAYRMGEVAVADIISRLDGTPSTSRMRYDAVPWAVYGLTEAAGVGITEEGAAAKGIPIIKASLPMRASGRFVAEHSFQKPGAVKVIAHAEDRRILGIHAVGPYSPEFIWGGSALIEQEFRIEEVRELIFPHPTVSELIRDAVWGL
jgi:dihydrolipoamide dehydrogenase